MGARNQKRATDAGSSHGSEVPDYVAAYVMELAKQSYKAEYDRRESMFETSNRLLTCDSVLSVAIVTLMPALSATFPNCKTLLSISSYLCLALIVVSIILGVISQYRFKFYGLPTPDAIFKEMDVQIDRFTSQYAVAKHYCDTMAEIQQTLKQSTDTLRNMNRVSLVLLLIASAILFFISALCVLLALTTQLT